MKAAMTPAGDMHSVGCASAMRVLAGRLCLWCLRPGEAYQFHWSHEGVMMGGVPQLRAAYFRFFAPRVGAVGPGGGRRVGGFPAVLPGRRGLAAVAGASSGTSVRALRAF